jgi:carbonic anhydrase/acetyltransferase-like protein (isoleucine patch superfamily)
MIHTDVHLKTIIGDDVTVEDACLIGMSDTILDDAFIGKGSIVGANSLVTQEIST